MKIKGPGNFTGLPSPPEDIKGAEGKGSIPFSPEPAAPGGAEDAARARGAGKAGAFENSLQEIARTSLQGGVAGDAALSKVVDSVLEQMLGKDFLGKPEASSLKSTMVPMLSQDEHFMNKLNSVLARLQKS